jgi:hypothetical protein
LARRGPPRDVGKRLRCEKGDYLVGPACTEVKIGTRLIADMHNLEVGWVKWADGTKHEESEFMDGDDARIVDHVMGCLSVSDDEWFPPRREETPAAIRPNERSESAFRAAANAVSAATVTPGAWPRAFRAALSRSSASLSLRGLLSAMPKPIPFREDRDSNLAVQRDCAVKRSCPGPLHCACACRAEPDGSRPASRGTGHSTAPFAGECQSFLDNIIAGLRV